MLHLYAYKVIQRKTYQPRNTLSTCNSSRKPLYCPALQRKYIFMPRAADAADLRDARVGAEAAPARTSNRFFPCSYHLITAGETIFRGAHVMSMSSCISPSSTTESAPTFSLSQSHHSIRATPHTTTFLGSTQPCSMSAAASLHVSSWGCRLARGLPWRRPQGSAA